MEITHEKKTTAHYLEAIKKNDKKALIGMYQKLLPTIENLVKKNNGDVEDAKDVLQDGLMVIFEKVQKPDFQLTSSFSTYLYSVCRFIWLRKLKKKQPEAITILEEERLMDERNINDILIREERQTLFNFHFNKLGEDCKTVLNLFFQGFKMKEIAEKMNYTDKFTKFKKYKCQKTLIESIKKDRLYRELV